MNRRNFLGAVGAGVVAANVFGKDTENTNVEKQDDLFAPIKAKLADKEPLIWVFTGDSITHGALHTYGWRSYVEHFQERIRFEMKRYTDIVINSGISGDTMKGITSRGDWRIFQFKPNIVSLKIGMNDCRDGEAGITFFKDSLKAFVEKTQKQKIILLLNTPNLIQFELDKARQGLPLYVEAIREIAKEYKLPLVDHYDYWQKETKGGARMQMWLNDGSIHPNNFGHIVLARKIFQDLDAFDAKSVVCGRLFVP